MSGRRRNTLVQADERADILTLSKGGYHQVDIAKMLDRSEVTIAKVLAEHRRDEREAHENDYKDMFKVSAKVAAENGDHKPALEWLDRYGAIPESSRQRTAILQARVAADAQRDVTRHLAKAGDGHGPVVNIGIGLPSQLVSQSLSHTVTIEEAPQNRALIVDGRQVPSTEGS